MASNTKNTKNTKKPKGISILTPVFRVSYPHVFKPQAMKGSDPKYSLVMLFKKTDDLAELQAAIKQVKIDAWGEDKEQWPEMKHPVVVNGDKPKFADREGYAGCWAIKAATAEDRKPGVVDENVEPIVDQSEFYAGCLARAQVYITTFDNEFGAGVRVVLDHVQKVGDGKSFGGKKQASEVFTPVNTGKKKAASDDEGFGDEANEDDEEF